MKCGSEGGPIDGRRQGKWRFALVAAWAWLAGWGSFAYVRTLDRLDAQAAWFLADSRQDWAFAQLQKAQAQSATRDILVAVCLGFVLPLSGLLLYELRRAAGRRP